MLVSGADSYARNYANSLKKPERTQRLKEILNWEIKKGLIAQAQ